MRLFIKILLVLLFSYSLYSQTDTEKPDINQERKDLFKEKTEQRIKDLESAILIISDKDLSTTHRNETIEAAVDYFISDKNIFEVSSLNRKDVQAFDVRRYLSRLKSLPYIKVEIEWVESQWISSFVKTPDGKYSATVRIFQVFRGYDMDGLKYKDITSKDIDVMLDVVSLDVGDKTKDIVLVKLGDVRVIETR